MANANIVMGRVPVQTFPWCRNTQVEFRPYLPVQHREGTPPFDSKMDGAYVHGYFTAGTDINPKYSELVRDALSAADLAVGDIIRCVSVVEDHYIKSVQFKSAFADSTVAGATVALTVESVIRNADGTFTYTELNDITTAATAQGVTNSIPLDEPSDTFISLVNTESGYAVPLYVGVGRELIFGVKILSLPTGANVVTSLASMSTNWSLVLKVEGTDTGTYF